jgi:hypothetical protein
MNSSKQLAFFSTMLFAGALVSCSNDLHPEKSEEEISKITTFYIDINPIGGGVPVELKYYDKEGDGIDPVITPSVVELQAGQAYTAEISLYNETGSSVEDLTEIIEDHQEDYMFCFNPEKTNMQISYLDKDENDLHVGLGSIWTAGESGEQGSVDINLFQHRGVKSGICGQGKRKAQISIPVKIVGEKLLNQ